MLLTFSIGPSAVCGTQGKSGIDLAEKHSGMREGRSNEGCKEFLPRNVLHLLPRERESPCVEKVDGFSARLILMLDRDQTSPGRQKCLHARVTATGSEESPVKSVRLG